LEGRVSEIGYHAGSDGDGRSEGSTGGYPGGERIGEGVLQDRLHDHAADGETRTGGETGDNPGDADIDDHEIDEGVNDVARQMVPDGPVGLEEPYVRLTRRQGVPHGEQYEDGHGGHEQETPAQLFVVRFDGGRCPFVRFFLTDPLHDGVLDGLAYVRQGLKVVKAHSSPERE